MTEEQHATLRHRASATGGGITVANSIAAIRVDRPDTAPELWFPLVDVDRGALATLQTSSWRRGTGDLAEHVAFDHDAVALVLRPLTAGADDAATPSIRFPNWGDAADLIEILDVQPAGDGCFVSAAFSDWRRPVVEGSQMLAQAIVAASRQAPGRRAVSASMVFTRPADARREYAIELDEVAHGRTFSAFGTRATQGGRICAAGTVLLDVTAPDVIRHVDEEGKIVGPADAVAYDMSVTGREVRVVDGAYSGDPDQPVGPPVIDTWVRFDEVPDDQPIHAALLAQFTGHMSIAAALRPHAGIGQDAAHLTLSTAVNAISISLHADVRADRWMRYRHRSTFAGDGMTHAECRVHDEAGGLLASFTTDCMVRAFADPGRGDARTAL